MWETSSSLRYWIVLYILCVNTAINNESKIVIKQHELTGRNLACERSSKVPESFVVPAVLKPQAATLQEPGRLRDLGLSGRQETQFLPAASYMPPMHEL